MLALLDNRTWWLSGLQSQAEQAGRVEVDGSEAVRAGERIADPAAQRDVHDQACRFHLRAQDAHELHGAELHGRLERFLRKYVKADLLAIDDFACVEMDPTQAKLAFQVISERYDYRRPTAITTNRPFKEWPKVFPDALNAQVIAERLSERCEHFVLEKGYRLLAAKP